MVYPINNLGLCMCSTVSKKAFDAVFSGTPELKSWAPRDELKLIVVVFGPSLISLHHALVLLYCSRGAGHEQQLSI